MDSIKYMLTRLTRINNLKTDDRLFGYGLFPSQVSTPSTTAILGYRRGGELYRGSARIDFNRIDLGLLFKNIEPEVELFMPKDKLAVFTALLQRYGLPDTDDVLADVINESLSGTEHPNEVTLSCGDGIFYKGTVTVRVKQRVMSLEEIVINRDLDIIVPRFLLTDPKVVLERRFYNYDFSFSPYIATLRTMKPTQYAHAADSWYVKMLNDADVKQECGNIHWQWAGSGSSAPYNLYLSKCLYNGPARDHPLGCPDYNYVAVFSCPGSVLPYKNHVGDFIFHYN